MFHDTIPQCRSDITIVFVLSWRYWCLHWLLLYGAHLPVLDFKDAPDQSWAATLDPGERNEFLHEPSRFDLGCSSRVNLPFSIRSGPSHYQKCFAGN